ncbi:nicotinate-nucleotide--dimethylbenzimidazole phosphoribosyltransferase [Luteococcus sp. Sow4_B9]|uniref:nicotinate-nucleotide--dimethylbenzimidazole phosphoribosyltransferase n=1 Tax=Luteococcus sp. Sow4_B9 TaxID=3438792 RepID=UPI003F9D9B71
MSLLTDTIAAITPVDRAARAQAEERQTQLTKPAGALGHLEVLGNQLAAITGQCPPPVPEPGLVCVFAGDHGIQERGVSPWPQEVTVQMAANIAQGGAGVNVLARAAGATVAVTDVGMLSPVEGCRDERIAAGTRDFLTGTAMTREQAEAAIEVGIRTAQRAADEGFRILVPGEVGIGNTTPAAALVCAFTGADPSEVTGRGAGANDEMLAHKAAVVHAALVRHQLLGGRGTDDPVGALAAVGGFEHAAITGLLLGAAARRLPVVLDGVIACSAALAAVALAPDVCGYLMSGHAGAEPAILCATHSLGLHPLLDLGLRLGEGSGGALALPIVCSAARVLREMATFSDAGVTEEHVE